MPSQGPAALPGLGALVNQARQQAGLRPLVLEPSLQMAAQAHADYLANQRSASHEQRPGLNPFSGRQPWDRARALGYAVNKRGMVGEAFAVGHDQAQSVLDHLLGGPYHRRVLLRARAAHYGLGQSDPMVWVLTLGADAPLPLQVPELVIWPVPDAQGLPPEVCCELPAPAGLEVFGQPVSVQAQEGQQLRVELFELLNPQGHSVPAALLHSGNDEALRFAPEFATLVPRQPLQPDTFYQVRLRVRADGQLLSREWRFRTGPQ